MRNPPPPPRSLLLFSRHVSDGLPDDWCGVPEIGGRPTQDGTPGIRDTDSVQSSIPCLRCDVRPISSRPATNSCSQTAVDAAYRVSAWSYREDSSLELNQPPFPGVRRRCSGAGTSDLPPLSGVSASSATMPGGPADACNLRFRRSSGAGSDVLRSYGDLGGPRRAGTILLRGQTGPGSTRGSAILPTVLPSEIDLTALDLFEKMDAGRVARIARAWRTRVGGGIFIP